MLFFDEYIIHIHYTKHPGILLTLRDTIAVIIIVKFEAFFVSFYVSSLWYEIFVVIRKYYETRRLI